MNLKAFSSRPQIIPILIVRNEGFIFRGDDFRRVVSFL